MGIIIDKTHTKMGKARPWLLFSMVPMALSLVLLFNVPSSFSMTGKIIYVGILYTLLGAVFYTANNTAYNTLTSLVTSNPKERVQLNALRFLCAMATILLMSSFSMKWVDKLGGGTAGFGKLSVIYGIMVIVSFSLTFLGTKEKVKATVEKVQEKISLVKTFQLLLHNKYFLLSVGMFFFFYTIQGMNSAATVYYVQYVLGNSDYMGTISLITYLPQIIGMMFIPVVIEKFGKRNTCLTGLMISMVGYAIASIYPDNAPIFFTGILIKTIGYIPMMASMVPFVADAVDYGDWKTGVRLDGTTYSCATFGIKVGSGISGVIVGWFLAMRKYVPKAAVQAGGALTAIKGLFLYLPAVLTVILLALMIFMNVEKNNERMRKEHLPDAT